MHHEKAFLTFLLPLSIATFFSAPLAVLHSFNLVDPFMHRVANYWLQDPWATSHQPVKFTIHVPLVVESNDLYADRNGKKTITLNDFRHWNLTKSMNQSLAMGRTPLYIAYVVMANSSNVNDPDPHGRMYPHGALVQVLNVTIEYPSLQNNFRHRIEWDTKYIRPLMVQQVLPSSSSSSSDANGIVYSHVELE